MFDPVQISSILGIDIAKQTFQCALLKAGKFKHKSFANNAKGYIALSDRLNQQGVGSTLHVCLEATSSYCSIAGWVGEPSGSPVFGRRHVNPIQTCYLWLASEAAGGVNHLPRALP